MSICVCIILLICTFFFQAGHVRLCCIPEMTQQPQWKIRVFKAELTCIVSSINNLDKCEYSKVLSVIFISSPWHEREAKIFDKQWNALQLKHYFLLALKLCASVASLLSEQQIYILFIFFTRGANTKNEDPYFCFAWLVFALSLFLFIFL